MSKEMQLAVNLPAHLQGVMAQYQKMAEFAVVERRQTFPRISTNGKRFAILETGAEPVEITTPEGHPVSFLEVVVIGWNPGQARAYYKGKYDPQAKEKASPVCWSHGGNKDAQAPHPSSSEPQAKFCKDCPHSVYGSKTNEFGKKAFACGSHRELLVLSPDDLEGAIYQVNASATAMKNWEEYFRACSRAGIPLFAVKTRLSFQKDIGVPVLEFSMSTLLSPEAIEIAASRMAEASVQEFMDVSFDTETDAPRTVLEPEEEEQATHQEASTTASAPAPVSEEKKATRGFGAPKEESKSDAAPDISDILDF